MRRTSLETTMPHFEDSEDDIWATKERAVEISNLINELWDVVDRHDVSLFQAVVSVFLFAEMFAYPMQDGHRTKARDVAVVILNAIEGHSRWTRACSPSPEGRTHRP